LGTQIKRREDLHKGKGGQKRGREGKEMVVGDRNFGRKTVISTSAVYLGKKNWHPIEGCRRVVGRRRGKEGAGGTMDRTLSRTR